MNLMTQVGYLLENKNEGEDGEKIFVYVGHLIVFSPLFSHIKAENKPTFGSFGIISEKCI